LSAAEATRAAPTANIPATEAAIMAPLMLISFLLVDVVVLVRGPLHGPESVSRTVTSLAFAGYSRRRFSFVRR
jgi:hypothetical protein